MYCESPSDVCCWLHLTDPSAPMLG